MMIVACKSGLTSFPTTHKEHALKQLYAMVDRQWPDIASSVPLIEELSEDSSFAVKSNNSKETDNVFSL